MTTDELLAALADERPLEFAKSFDDMMKDRINKLVADRKVELSQALFGAPETTPEEPEETEEENPDAEAEEEDTDDTTPEEGTAEADDSK